MPHSEQVGAPSCASRGLEDCGLVSGGARRIASVIADTGAVGTGAGAPAPVPTAPVSAMTEAMRLAPPLTNPQSSKPRDAHEGAPTCSECGMLMVPNGACYKCENCGSTSGCS